MASIRVVASAIASAMTQTEWIASCLSKSVAKIVRKHLPWVEPLADRILQQYPVQPRQRTLAEFILRDVGFQIAFQKHQIQLADWPIETSTNQPLAFASGLALPKLDSVDQLAEWLGLEIRQLEWIADCRNLNKSFRSPQLTHYHYRVLSKRFGSIRLIEAPKPKIKGIQRKILDNILSLIPPHSAAQGFRRGSSTRSFALPHINQQIVLKMDLKDFFPSVPFAQVRGIFRSIGYSDCVAEMLSGICTNSVSSEAWTGLSETFESWTRTQQIRDVMRRYAVPHLPQGAPTSPALANLAAYRLDCRLSGLARSADANYTRYADDLAFSGPSSFHRSIKQFYHLASSIVLEEGFQVNFRKTRIMPCSVRQQVAGLVINSHLNISRCDFDNLKAILTNCLRSGPENQNRDGHPNYRQHLYGRISYVSMIAPGRGQKLKAIFDRIKW